MKMTHRQNQIGKIANRESSHRNNTPVHRTEKEIDLDEEHRVYFARNEASSIVAFPSPENPSNDSLCVVDMKVLPRSESESVSVEEELDEGYRKRAERSKKLVKEFENVSNEANEHI